ncbi:MAG: stage II sporulation protein M, partial [Methylocystaceae bacterium]
WWLTMSLLGLTVIGVLLVLPLIFFKGYCVGYTVYTLSRAHNDTSMGLALTAVLPHNLIYIPCLVVMAAAALRFSVALFSPERNGNTIIKSLLAYVIIMLLAGGGIWLGALVECRVTPWLLHWW